MIYRVWSAFVAEWHKALFHRMTWIAPLFVALVAFAIPTLRPLTRDGESDYGFVLFSANILHGNLLMLFVLILCTNLLATDIAGGLARHVLVRPLRMGEWYAAKLFFALSYALALTLLASLLPWGIAFTFGDLGGVAYGGELIYTSREAQYLYLACAAMTLPPLWAGAALGLLFSALSRNALSAACLAIALWVVADTAKYGLGIENWVFTSWLEGAWRPLGDMISAVPYSVAESARLSVASSAAFFVPTVALTAAVLRRRNLTK